MIPRYTRAEMGRIWTGERRYRIWLDVELLACEAMVGLGEVPAADLARLRKVFDGYQLTAADVARIEEIAAIAFGRKPLRLVVAPPLASSRKQLTAPVWHAGPAGATVNSTASVMTAVVPHGRATASRVASGIVLTTSRVTRSTT